MADNVLITAGTDTTVATDDVANVHFQKVKINLGGDGVDGALWNGAVTITSGTVTLASNSGIDVGDVTINNASGASAVNIQDGGNTITVDNGGTFAVQVDGAALTSLQLLDDTVYVDDGAWTDNVSKHILVGGVYQSAPQTVTNGKATPFLTDSAGRLATVLGGFDINGIDTDSGSATASTLRVVLATETVLVGGDIAHDAADSGNPVKIGGKASTSPPPAVANGDRVNAWFDEYGRVQVAPVKAIPSGDVISISGNVLLAPQRQPINVNTNGQILVSGIVNRKIRVLHGLLMAPTAVTVNIKSNNNYDLSGPTPLGATGGFQIPHADIGNFETLPGQNLTIALSASVQVGGWLTYVIV